MKKMILFILMMTVSVYAKAEGLNPNATYIKKNYPNEYEKTIKKHALEKWGDDYSMVIYMINKQSDALVNLVETFKSENTNIAIKAIQKWSIDGYQNSNIALFKEMEVFGLKELLKMHCDWSMVKYEYDKQVKAKNSF